MYSWRVEIEERREYKIERRPRWKGIRELREKYCSTKSCTCNHIQEIYTRSDLLGLCRWRFSLDKPSLFLLIVVGIPYKCDPTRSSPVFQLTLYKFIVLGFLGLDPYLLSLGLILRPYNCIYI